MDLDGPALDFIKRRAKQQIRQRMRALRSALPAAARAERSRRIVERLLALAEVEGARAIALFWPMVDRGEVDLSAADPVFRERGLRVFYPFMGRPGDERTLGFASVEDPADLRDGGRGFLEPSADAPVARPGELDVVVVPALAVCGRGFRIGYGAGFYDVVLPLFCPPARSVVVAYGFELLAELPTADHDVPCDVVVTDDRTLRVRSDP